MVMNVEIISKETVEPSSPTPHHLRDLRLSFLDQLAPPIYVPIIYFYHVESDSNVDHDHFERSCSLKKSLAETLTSFYPLAGTIKEDFSVDCNDRGIEFIDARVSCKLSEVIKEPDVKVLNQFLPFEPYGNDIELGREVLLAVQFNIFDCGGVAIGVCVSHKIADGTSATTFVNAWAATSRGTSEAVHPSFDVASYFPPREISRFMRTTRITKDKIVTRRFVFKKSNIIALREEASSAVDSQVKRPTRVEVVSAFIWKRFMAIARSKSIPAKVFAAIHAVNLRERSVPPLPMHSFGNLYCTVIAPSTVEAEKKYHILVNQLRNAIRQVNGDYVRKLQNGDDYMDSKKKTREQFSMGEIEFCSFSSWCRFPLYEVDFGWGKPTWVCCPSSPFKNVVIFTNTKDGDEIEACVNMLEEDMAMFECDLELLSFVSSTVSE